MRNLRGRQQLWVWFLALSACDSAAPECREQSDCGAQQLCLDSSCRTLCNEVSDCLGSEACVSGLCETVASPECETNTDCETTDPCLLSSSAVCQAGECSFSPRERGAACDDGLLCTDGDICDGAGTCVGIQRVCNAPPLSECLGGDSVFRTYESVGACDAETGDCAYNFEDAPCSSCFTNCLSCSVDDDCDSGQYCFDSLCTPQIVAGGSCATQGPGACATGYCDGSLCCTSGDCCNNGADCPSSYGGSPACDDTSPATNCQGSRPEATCTNNVCTTVSVDDDSACDGVEFACPGNLAAVECSSSVAQAPPTCPANCALDEDCAAGYLCNGGSCELPSGVGGVCSGPGDCESGLQCENTVCCDAAETCCSDSSMCASGLACNTSASYCWNTCNDFDSSRCGDPGGTYCLNDACVAKKSNGDSCAADGACMSGNCECGDASCSGRRCVAIECDSCGYSTSGSECDGVLAVCQIPEGSVFRSVGTNSADLNVNGRNLGIMGSTAAFSGPLEDYVGVGDVLQYNDGTNWHIAFIHGRTSANTFTVKAANGDTPAPTPGGTSVEIFRAYRSLADASVNSENDSIRNELRNFDSSRNLIARDQLLNIACYGDSTDTESVDFDGWTTDSEHYVRVFTPVSSSEVGISQRHNGSWTPTAYLLSSDSQRPLELEEIDIVIEGLQIRYAPLITANGGAVNSNSSQPRTVTLSQNIIRGTSVLFADFFTGYAQEYQSDVTTYFYNNVVYGFSGFGEVNCLTIEGSIPTGYFYNNTLYDCQVGVDGDQENAVFRNNLLQNCGGDCFAGVDENAASSHNVTEDDTALGTNVRLNTDVEFVEPTMGDFHLAPSDTGAFDAGTDLSGDANLPVTDDIDGDTRSGTWSSGADQR